MITGGNALVICNLGPSIPGSGREIALDMSEALTKVLPRQCGGNTQGFLYLYRQKEP